MQQWGAKSSKENSRRLILTMETFTRIWELRPLRPEVFMSLALPHTYLAHATHHSTVANFGNIRVVCSSQRHSTLCKAHRQLPWNRLLCKSASLFLGRTWVLAPSARYERRFAGIPCISCVRHHPFDTFYTLPVVDTSYFIRYFIQYTSQYTFTY
jgi:hypothetical protein